MDILVLCVSISSLIIMLAIFIIDTLYMTKFYNDLKKMGREKMKTTKGMIEVLFILSVIFIGNLVLRYDNELFNIIFIMFFSLIYVQGCITLLDRFYDFFIKKGVKK